MIDRLCHDKQNDVSGFRRVFQSLSTRPRLSRSDRLSGLLHPILRPMIDYTLTCSLSTHALFVNHSAYALQHCNSRAKGSSAIERL